jgi:hypothetical protein
LLEERDKSMTTVDGADFMLEAQSQVDQDGVKIKLDEEVDQMFIS